MGDVYMPEPAHYCQLPEKHARPLGSIWYCDECGTYYAFKYTESSWGPVWSEVRWWNFKERRRIKEAAGE